MTAADNILMVLLEGAGRGGAAFGRAVLACYDGRSVRSLWRRRWLRAVDDRRVALTITGLERGEALQGGRRVRAVCRDCRRPILIGPGGPRLCSGHRAARRLQEPATDGA